MARMGIFKTKGTKVVVKYDVGFNNVLYIRGEGADLNWSKGTPLKNISNDEWVWETTKQFSECDFKVLINDEKYESGENHHLKCGTNVSYTPSF